MAGIVIFIIIFVLVFLTVVRIVSMNKLEDKDPDCEISGKAVKKEKEY